MNPGELKHRIEIWGKGNERKNELNETEYPDILLKTVWAKIIDKSGSLLYGRPANTIASKTTHVITIRYNSFKELKTDNWIIYNGIRFDIDYISNKNFNKEFFDIYVQAVVE